MSTRRWAFRLGWFSLGLGLAELVAARSLARGLGLRRPELVRAYGARELAAGIGLLASRTEAARAAWFWARVAGDALHVATLGRAVLGRRSRRSRPKRAVLALAALSPVVGLDIACALELSKASQEGVLPEDAAIGADEAKELQGKALTDRVAPARAAGEAAGRARGEQFGGGRAGNDLLEDDQPRGIDEEGRMVGGTHGGPRTEHIIEGQDPPDIVIKR